MKARLLVVGCGFPQLGLLRAARSLGVATIGVDKNPSAVGVPLVDELLEVSTGDVDAVVSAARRSGATAITSTGSELALTTTVHAAERLALPFYADAATIHRCQAKDAMRAAYEAASLPVPRFAACMTFEDAMRFVRAVGVPVVVKPARGWGQRGVSRVDDPAALPVAFDAAFVASHGHAGVVVEECIVGRELSVNGWVEDGRLVAYAVTDREVFPGTRPLGVMRSEVVPCTVSDAERAAAVDAAARAASSLGLRRGPCYTQVCVTANGPVVFETAARCGGGFDADVTKLVSGVDLYRRVLGVALDDRDLEREGAISEKHAAALVRFLAPPTGTVRAIEGLSLARAIEGVVDVDVYAKPGDHLDGLVNAASRVGHVLAVGRSREEAVERADRAVASIAIRVG